mmetsp:Transcript_15596/g.49752  ORF Transcript_15596/g.49752 Transcript_15596/m.49752 type:complete len:351 (+) Transcript_15596:246-1298(+)
MTRLCSQRTTASCASKSHRCEPNGREKEREYGTSDGKRMGLRRSLGIKQNEGVVEVINGEAPPDHVAVDSLLGPVGARALVEALMARQEGLTGAAYQLLTTIRLWRSNLGEEGVRAIADLLLDTFKRKLEPNSVDISYLQLMDCNVTVAGCGFLSRVLQSGGNAALVTLNLDHNDQIGTAGLRALTEGLCTNVTLRRLSLAYCEIDAEAGRAVKNLLLTYNSALEELNLKGNRLSGKALLGFARALGKNAMLKSLDLSNNDIGPDKEALQALCEALKVNKTLLQLKLQENHIGDDGAKMLTDSGVFDKKDGNTTLKEFVVDVKLQTEVFDSLMRAGGGGGKKGGKKKGKK